MLRRFLVSALVFTLSAEAALAEPPPPAPKPSPTTLTGSKVKTSDKHQKEMLDFIKGRVAQPAGSPTDGAAGKPAGNSASAMAASGKRSEVKDSNDRYANIEVGVQAAPPSKDAANGPTVAQDVTQNKAKTSDKNAKAVLDFVKQ